jgi:hypothetical protein
MVPGQFEEFLRENQEQVDALLLKFGDYEPVNGFDKAHLTTWLAQFQPQHRSGALKLAESIRYFGIDSINTLMPRVHSLISDQISQENADANSVFYVPFGSTGDSGEDIVRRYKTVNKLQRLQNQFISKVQLLDRIVKADNPVVFFLDDFVATGKQVSDYWQQELHQYVLEYVPMYLAVIAARSDGIKRIEAESPLKVLSVHTIGNRHCLLHSANTDLSNSEKLAVHNYCKKAGNQPLGFGDLGLLVSFAYGTPNNTISAIRGSERQRPWRGLLPRWEDL